MLNESRVIGNLEARTIPVSKTCVSATLQSAQPETWPTLDTLEQSIAEEGWDSEQHPYRRWEYAMALEALRRAFPSKKIHLRTADFGSRESMFARVLHRLGHDVTVYDRPEVLPQVAPDEKNFHTVGRLLGQLTEEDHGRYDAVFSISVLEHTEDDQAAWRDLLRTVAEHGLVFITVDFAPSQPDHYVMANLRRRIYTQPDLEFLQRVAEQEGFHVLGRRTDWRWAGPWVYDYTFASLGVVR